MRLELYYAIVVFGLAVGLALRHCLSGTGKIILLLIAVVHAGFLLLALQFAAAAGSDADPVAAPPYFLNIRHFGYQGFFGASAAVAVALVDKRLRTAGVLLAMAALFGIIMFGSRGALLAWLLFVLAAIGLVPDRRTAIMVSVLVTTGALALAIVAERHDWMNTYSLLDRTRIPTGDTISMLYVQDRIQIWMDSLATIAQRPVLGFGPNGYVLSGCCNRMVAQPHNAILQLLLEFGVVGFVALAWTAASLFGPRIRGIVLQTAQSKRDPVHATALAILVGFAGFSMIDGLLYFPVPLINFALVCARSLLEPHWGAAPTRSEASTAALFNPQLLHPIPELPIQAVDRGGEGDLDVLQMLELAPDLVAHRAGEARDIGGLVGERQMDDRNRKGWDGRELRLRHERPGPGAVSPRSCP